MTKSLKKSFGAFFITFLIYASTILSQVELIAAAKPKIVVIGAGASGIASATKLLEYGFEDVTIIEAEPRIGGRIHTVPNGGNVIDLGASWCHGQKHNVVYELVKDLHLLEASPDLIERATVVRSNGEFIPDETSARLLKILKDIEKNYVEESLRYTGSMHEFFGEFYKKILNKTENEDLNWNIAQEFLANYEQQQVITTGTTTLDEVPAYGDLEYEVCEGEFHLNWKRRGFKELLSVLMKSAELNEEEGLLNGRIEYSEKVKQINWRRKDNKVLINCESGKQILADHVIVTVSLGVLKVKHRELFKPILPSYKQRAIEGIGYGTINKIFIEFPEQFWPSDWTGFSMLWRSQELSEINDTKMDWLSDVIGFYTASYQSKTLEGLVVGTKGPQIESLSDEEIKAACMYLFISFLPWNIPEATNVVTTTWSTNTNFYGSYSGSTIKQEDMNVSRDDLTDPLYAKPKNCTKVDEGQNCKVPLLLFAGEATNTKHHSTVHGAVETGWREAERLAIFYGLK